MTSLTPTNQRKEIAALSARGWVSLRQFAVLVDISYPTATKLMNEGKVLGVKVGGITRIYADEVRRFLTEGNLVDEASEGEKSPSLPS